MGKETRLPDRRTRLEKYFPGLRESEYSVTSEESPRYNCIAWAAGDKTRWWDPNWFWPVGVRREYTFDAYREAFESLGYRETDSLTLEPGIEKVVLFARIDSVPTHAARQLSDGRWTSKLGQLDDIAHDLYAIQGPGHVDLTRMDDYGFPTLVMMRVLSSKRRNPGRVRMVLLWAFALLSAPFRWITQAIRVGLETVRRRN